MTITSLIILFYVFFFNAQDMLQDLVCQSLFSGCLGAVQLRYLGLCEKHMLTIFVKKGKILILKQWISMQKQRAEVYI
jgi:hypothetical protein